MEPQPTTSHKKLITWLIVAIVIMSVVYGFYARYSTKPVAPSSTASNQNVEAELPVIIRHQYKNGKHTFIGELSLPNPCYSVTSDVTAPRTTTASKSATVINLKTKTTADGCITVVTSYPFKVSVAASRATTFTFTKDSNPFKYSIVEAADSEDLDKFDPYVKG